jgi:hypothetical protein
MSEQPEIQASDERYLIAIRRHVFEKVPLGRALREARFSASYSRRSKNDLTKNSKPFAAAWRFVEAEKRAKLYTGHSKDSSPANLIGEPDRLKATVKQRLIRNVEDGRDEGVRSAQLLGKFKEHDWWVRNEDAPVGVFVALSTRKEAITAQANAIDSYED